MKFFWTLVITLFIAFPVTAHKSINWVADFIEKDSLSFAKREQMNDTLRTELFNKYLASLDSLYSDTLVRRPVRPNSDYYRLFVPFTYYHSPLQRGTDLSWKDEELTFSGKISREMLPANTKLFSQATRRKKLVDEILLEAYKKHSNLIVRTEEQIMSKSLVQVDFSQKAPSNNPILKLFAAEKPEERVMGTDLIIRKPNFWVTGGNGSFQLTQNYISDNWYQGGESMNSVLTNFRLFANYNDKQKMQFESFLEAKAGFNTVSSDTIRKYRVNNNLLRLYGKVGIQAASKWFYTVSAEFNTQFFKNYKANTNQLVSSFLAPANIILSVGMDYKLVKKDINLSVFLSPLAYNLRYVGNEKVNEMSFGLEEGKKTLHDFGSKLQTTLSWKIIPSIIYDTRLFYFTSYKKVEAEWESTFNFVLNRYLSTKLFFHVRYDDGVVRKDGHGYFQFREFLSFGANYTW